MGIVTESIDLPGLAPGASHRLITHTFDGAASAAGAPRSAYIQAGLHADEHPGLLAIAHLLRHLVALERDGKLRGRIVVRPFANPVGMAQRLFGMPVGRFNLENGENFNRRFPSIVDDLHHALRNGSSLESFSRNDTPAFKALFAALLERRSVHDPVAATKLTLLREALKHDVVIDLHCDTRGILHLYSNRAQQRRATTLAASLGIETVFLEDVAGGAPIDEAYMQPWLALRDAGLVDDAHLGFCASIELRGQADVDDTLAERDARGILRFLAADGFIDRQDDDDEAEPATSPRIYPLEGASHVPAPATGIVVYRRRPGDAVRKGDLIAEIVPLDGALEAPRHPVYSDVDGIVVVQQQFALVRAGQRVALLAGTEPLAHRKAGALLQDF